VILDVSENSFLVKTNENVFEYVLFNGAEILSFERIET
jgi:hypothetical protein